MNKKSLSLSYQTFFTSIFQKDLCTLPVLLTLENCTTLLDGTAVNVNKISYKYQGLQIVILRFIDFFRSSSIKYLDYQQNPNITSPLQKYNSFYLIDLDTTITYFLKPTLQYFNSEMKLFIISIFENELNYRLIVFICYLGFILIGYLIFWMPFQSQIKDEIIRTRKMLEIVPIQILDRMKNLNLKVDNTNFGNGNLNTNLSTGGNGGIED